MVRTARQLLVEVPAKSETVEKSICVVDMAETFNESLQFRNKRIYPAI